MPSSSVILSIMKLEEGNIRFYLSGLAHIGGSATSYPTTVKKGFRVLKCCANRLCQKASILKVSSNACSAQNSI
eukprot:4810396-Amphidinium_carterae.1